MKKLLLPLGFILLFAAEIFRVYYIMPFPGSQQSNTITIAYFLHKWIWIIRVIGLVLIIYGVWNVFPLWKKWKKVVFFTGILLYIGVFYLVNFKFLADKMFYQPRQKLMLSEAGNRVSPDRLVLGVSYNNEAKAYPIEIIGYHHQVQDTVGGVPVMITYCTVCRTGRAFSPLINGKKESFRLVGMDHFNAMFEDNTTKSWWRQATGEAITGKRKGMKLEELPSKQVRLSSWLREHPNTLILQPDPSFTKEYANLEGFDLGILNSGLEKRDSGSWNFKSWVLGIDMDGIARAYDWNLLIQKRLINDELGRKKLLLYVEKDNASFHVWDRTLNGRELIFILENDQLKDAATGSLWNDDGICTDGQLKGEKLTMLQASQEFWHSWKQFHPTTTIYK